MSTQPIILESSDVQSDIKLQAYKELMKYQNDTEQCENPVYRNAISRVYVKLKLNECCKITHLSDLFRKDSEVWSESPGLPWCEMGYQTKADIRDNPKAVNSVRRFWHYVKLSIFPKLNLNNIEFDYCLVKSGPTGTKSSVEWKYPATINFGEAAFTTNLIKAYSEQGHLATMAYEYKTDPDGCKRLYHRLNQQNKYYVKLNFHENSVPVWLMDVAFDMLSANIDYCHYAENGVPDARQMIKMYEEIKNYFIYTRIRLENGTKMYKRSGLASGSHFTELVGSVISAIIVEYLSCLMDSSYAEDLVVLGNESLARIKSYWDLNVCQDILKRDFGMTINLSQGQLSKNLKQIRFLGYKKDMDDVNALLTLYCLSCHTAL